MGGCRLLFLPWLKLFFVVIGRMSASRCNRDTQECDVVMMLGVVVVAQIVGECLAAAVRTVRPVLGFVQVFLHANGSDIVVPIVGDSL